MKKHPSTGVQPTSDGGKPSGHQAQYSQFSHHQIESMLERARDHNGVLRLLVAAYTGLQPRDLAYPSWSGITTAVATSASRNGGNSVRHRDGWPGNY